MGDEELRGSLVGGEQSCPVAVVAVRLAAVFVVQFEPDAGGHPLDRFGERGVVHLLQEAEHVAVFAASEAVVAAHLRSHVEAGAALVVERAEALERADSGALERDVVSDDIRDVDPRAQFVEVRASDQACHGTSLGRATVVHARGAGQPVESAHLSRLSSERASAHHSRLSSERVSASVSKPRHRTQGFDDAGLASSDGYSTR